MRRFRTQWLAFFGALVVLSFSLSTAFAARPTVDANTDASFGHQVSTFVHILLAGNPDEDSGEDESDDEAGDTCEPADEDSGGDEDGDADSGDDESGTETGDESGDQAADDCDDQADEDGGDEDTGDEDAGDEDAGGEDSADSDAQNHGQCVAEVAQSDAVGDNDTHGWAVVLAAQITCWLEEQSDESGDETDGDTGTGDEDADSTDTSAQTQTHGKSDAAHQRKLDRGAGKPSWAGVHSGSHGKGHGHSF